MKTLSAPRSRSLCLALLLSGLLSSGHTLPHLRSLDSSSLSSPPISEDNDSPRRHTQWEVLYPSISLRDWSVQMMSPPELPAPKLKPRLLSALDWLPSSQSEEESLVREAGLGKSWPSDWSAQAADAEKRNIVVADDAAFREKKQTTDSHGEAEMAQLLHAETAGRQFTSFSLFERGQGSLPRADALIAFERGQGSLPRVDALIAFERGRVVTTG